MGEKEINILIKNVRTKFLTLFVGALFTMLITNFLFITTINNTIKDLRETVHEIKESTDLKIENLNTKIFQLTTKNK